MTEPDWGRIAKGFDQPFPAEQIKSYTKKTKTGSITLHYIDARDVMIRLDAIVGKPNWRDDYLVLDAEKYVVECRLTVHGITKTDCGYPNNPGSEMETEPMKAAYSDAIKRAAVKWGIGRHLYDKSPASAPQNGQNRAERQAKPATPQQIERIVKGRKMLGIAEPTTNGMTDMEADDVLAGLHKAWQGRKDQEAKKQQKAAAKAHEEEVF